MHVVAKETQADENFALPVDVVSKPCEADLHVPTRFPGAI